MRYDPDKHHRGSIRLKGYDYSRAGAYFVTICVQERECLFGEVVDGEMQLNDAGRMIQGWWGELTKKFPSVVLDDSIVMPNHLHGIIFLKLTPATAADLDVVGRLGALLVRTHHDFDPDRFIGATAR